MSIDITYTFTKFKGTKNLDPILRKKKAELTVEEIWDRILGGGYEQAYCPDCHTKLLIKSFSVEYQLSPSYPMFNTSVTSWASNWHIRIGVPIIKIELECPVCQNVIEGIGEGLSWEGVSYYLNSLTVILINRRQYPLT